MSEKHYQPQELCIHLPKNFRETLIKETKKELETAQQKWNIQLTPTQKKHITKHAITQLENKTAQLTNRTWRINHPTIKILIKGKNKFIKDENPLNLTQEPLIGYNQTYFIRVHNGWKVDTENNNEKININNFREHIIKNLTQWTKTAIFYGVASHRTETYE